MKKVALLIISVFAVSGCDNTRRQPNIELIQDMMVSPSVKAQDEDPNSMKLPPEGTIPQGWTPYKMASFEEASAKLVNPTQKSHESIVKGQKLYMTFCFPCHGAKADGQGPMVQLKKWPAAIPSLLSQRARDYKDGYFYHIMTVGRGLMGSYANQVRPDERWHLINYVRHVQANSPVVE